MNTVKPESLALFCLTPGGVALAERLRVALPVTCFTSERLLRKGFRPFVTSFAQTVKDAFYVHSALIFIGATGIAVRMIAPLLQDKMSDPAVVVIDERGQHVISLVSGHMGGANALACYLAGVLGADPVITTATDVNGLAALDTLASQLDAGMENLREGVKTINQMLVSGKSVGIWWDDDFAHHQSQVVTEGFIPVSRLAELPQLDALVCVTLRDTLPELNCPVFKLVPRRIVAGIGCRRNTPFTVLHKLVAGQLQARRLDSRALRAIGSIDLKQDEPGLQALAQCYQVPFEIFTANELQPSATHFPVSAFVREVAGVGSVSGPVAWLMSGGHLLGETLREQGVTLTLGVVH
ncbi:cobalt-precorrin 5A hydrolase [Mangrovibacter yixingensis]|uniref:cobalt-precorrin 5A hydrolase n=1 Tax=Mangrovibacter yixingensis TaxID=1529639 RepID=UPI001CFBEAA7|nr:cobalt-precorrin 5A hydrolase [Mangrovibacter yixingensis]